MSTRKIVPNGDNEGGLGTADKRFASIYVTAPETGANDSRAVNAKWVQALVAQAKKEALLEAHPVGSYYWSNDSTDPGTLFGGTWEALPAGYTLIAQGSGSDSFGSFTYTAGQKYGERKHQLTTDEMASHSHESPDSAAGAFTGWGNTSFDGWVTAAIQRNDGGLWRTKSTGGDQPHNNIPPVIASYAWRRTA